MSTGWRLGAMLAIWLMVGSSGAALAQDTDGAAASPSPPESAADALASSQTQTLPDAPLPDAPLPVEPLPVEPLPSDSVSASDTAPATTKGIASWYGRQFHGRKTASGERFNMYGLTAAHKTLPLMTYVRVRNPLNGKNIVVRITDRGPYARNRMIDLSYGAAQWLGIHGLGEVEMEPVDRSEYEAQVNTDDIERELRQASYVAQTPPRRHVARSAKPAARR